MRFDSLWGIVNNSYEAMDGFHTMRSEKLWLPTSPQLSLNFEGHYGPDSLAAASAFVRNLASTYEPSLVDMRQYTGELSYALVERFRRLSTDEMTASHIPSLILADGLAATLVGTKTSIRTTPVGSPPMLTVNDPLRGLPRAKVVVYHRVLCYDFRYAIPAFLLLVLLIAAFLWATGILVASRSALRTLRNMYNQTSAGRLATNLLFPEQSDPNQSTKEWAKGGGTALLSFGRISQPEANHFCRVRGSSKNSGSGYHDRDLDSERHIL